MNEKHNCKIYRRVFETIDSQEVTVECDQGDFDNNFFDRAQAFKFARKHEAEQNNPHGQSVVEFGKKIVAQANVCFNQWSSIIDRDSLDTAQLSFKLLCLEQNELSVVRQMIGYVFPDAEYRQLVSYLTDCWATIEQRKREIAQAAFDVKEEEKRK